MYGDILLIRAIQGTLDGIADYYDLRIVEVTGTDAEMKGSEVTKAISGKDTGACVRVLYKGAWGFASAPGAGQAAIKEAAHRALRIAKGISEYKGDRVTMAPVAAERESSVIPMGIKLESVPLERKLGLMRETYEALADYDFIVGSTLLYKDSYTREDFYSSDGAFLKKDTPRVFWQLEVSGKRDGDISYVRRRIGRTSGFEAFGEDLHIKLARDAAASLVAVLNGKHAPSGPMPVIVDPGLAGTFAHEAVGHACEGDLVATGNSCTEGLMGKKIASEIVTIKDDATIPGLFGSYVYDDEGVRTRTKTLIKDGILSDYILNRETAAKLNMEPNGGARAESYHGRPLVRMSNTFIERGSSSFKEMIEGIKSGVYAKGTRGGQVNTSQGFFQFNAQEAYLIENGEIVKPLRDVSLSGRTLETLMLIDMVGNDPALGNAGLCGKGQTVPVGDGGPHIRISKCVVGGG